ncbi:MAG: DUF6522 family protein [Hoeflea sp.]|uniref:DUF6522 family protein n=1 Tax=Hoeflea sp. TaxID=1940281 RepID=UPI0027308D37|nr:DUF6522 family protein [Hoeflea sp.]MDP2122122.1 DUF6522 family protein [Hoeflea sp.]MDP3526360.1 DUF6522 family protein [Hoeflea sp.]
MMRVEFSNDGIVIDAALVGPLFDLEPAEVHELMRNGEITSLCEAGIDEHEGEFRLSFFFRGRRVRLQVAASGEVLRRSTIDYGDNPLPNAMHRPGG